MRIDRAVLLVLSLVPLNAAAQTYAYALGIGSSSPDSIELRVDGKPKTFHVTAEAPSPATQAFLNCLVAGRVVHIGAHGELSMLDGNEIPTLLHEFTQSKTTIDPCVIGKAAYVPAYAPKIVAAPAPRPPAPKAATPPPEPPKKKLGGVKPKAPEVPPDDAKMRSLGQAFPSKDAVSPPPPRSDAPPSVLAEPVTTMRSEPVGSMPTTANPNEPPKPENPKTTNPPPRPPV